jgi:Ca2+-binding RTX toxin-like protein
MKTLKTLETTETTTVQQALQIANNSLSLFASSPDFNAKMQLAFGNHKIWSTPDLIDFPTIEIRPAAEINNARGAFAAATNTIYLSQELVDENSGNVGAIASVLVEEYGHYLDAQNNAIDSPGDEGELFANLVLGKGLSESELLALWGEDDSAIVVWDGEGVSIEQKTLWFFDLEPEPEVVNGTSEDDYIQPGQGDTVYGGAGNDGIDYARGTQGGEYVDGGDGDDTVGFATEGSITLDGGSGDDVLYGSNGNSKIDGQSGNDELNGAIGNDTLIGGAGYNTYYGAEGDDIYIVQATSGGSNQNLGGIIDDDGGIDQLILEGGTLSFTPTGDEIGLSPGNNYDLILDLNRDGVFDENYPGYQQVLDLEIANFDLQIANFFDDKENCKPSWGFIETVGNLSGQEILDYFCNQKDQPSISITNATNKEGEDLVFTVSLSEPTDEIVTVPYTIQDDTATLGEDYFGAGGTIEFNPGEPLSQTITIGTFIDTEIETDETFLVKLSDPENAQLSNDKGIGTITDVEDEEPSISIEDAWVKVDAGKDKTATLKFKVKLSNTSGRLDEPVTVKYSTTDGTAVSQEQPDGEKKDYEPVTEGEVTFTGSETEKEIEITVLGDTPVEYDANARHAAFEIFAKDTAYSGDISSQYPDLGYSVDETFSDDSTGFYAVGLTSHEDFKVTLSNAENASLETTEATGTIYDSGKPPVLAIRGTANAEGTIDDFDPRGVGYDQFLSNQGRLIEWLSEVSQPEDGVTFEPSITGHSLGGALTQWVANEFTKQGNQLGEIVTFNSPGISASSAYSSGTVTHYVSSGDVVSMAGEAYLPGDYVLSEFSGITLKGIDFSRLNPAYKHLAPVIIPDNFAFNNSKPDPIKEKDRAGASKLSSFFFNYYPDPDYFALQVGVATLTAIPEIITALAGKTPVYAAIALTFRGTTEYARKKLGIKLGEIIDSIDLASESLKKTIQVVEAAKEFSTNAWKVIQFLSKLGTRILETNYLTTNEDEVKGLNTQINQFDILLNQALPIAQSRLQEFANRTDFHTQMNTIFGTNWDLETANSLISQIATPGSEVLPPIQVVPSSEIEGANGAFGIQENIIYVSSEFLNQNANNPEAIISLLLEEIGHFIDSQINLEDAPGDEGEIFANLVQNIQLSPEQLQALQNEDDLSVSILPSPAWEAFGKWSGEAWLTTTQWSDNAWDIMTQWSEVGWQTTTQWTPAQWKATLEWTPEQWDATTQWTPEQWNQTLIAPLSPIISSGAILITIPTPNITDDGTETGLPPNTNGANGFYLTDGADTAVPTMVTGQPLFALSNKDNVIGTETPDYINGNQGADSINGIGGDDTLFGGQGSDQIDGGADNDLIYGDNENDIVEGGEGNDTLYGGSRRDILIGGAGDDILAGDAGQDILTGEVGNDTFVLADGEAAAISLQVADVITDFSAGDKIGLTDGLTFANLTLESISLSLNSAEPITATALKVGENYLGIVAGFVPESLTADAFVSV